MKYTLLISLLMAATVSSAAIERTIEITHHVDVDGTKTYYKTTDKILATSPVWRPGDGNPPLSIDAAVKSATKWVSEKHPSFRFHNIACISLGSIWDSDLKDRWHYTVSINMKADVDGVQVNRFFHVIVLMNGEIVPPNVPEK